MSLHKVEFFRHNIGPEEIKTCNQALESLFHTTGPACARFEQEFAQYLGVGQVVTVANCTLGLEIALTALDIGPGDEVITTPMTFIATSNAIIKVGATPVFVDVEADTGNMDATQVEAAVTPRTKAILPVHLYGLMCDMVRLGEIADRHRLHIVSDSAHAIESKRDGYGSADLCQAAVYSFYTTKNISCGEGGALATNSEDLAERFKVLRLHGMSKGAADRYAKEYQHWDMVELGFKGNLSDILASLLIPQLPRIEERLKRREELARRYEDAFNGLPGVDYPRSRPGSKHGRHLFTIWVDQRDRFMKLLQAKGIGVAVNYRAVHLLSYYRRRFGFKPGDFPEAERIGEATIALPLYPRLSDAEAEQVINAVRETAHEIAGSSRT
ncbi:MAG: DegT/DnrJ/EryC1/StrS aminotransferase family protein [Desulfarculaceae bacterium]|jgi:UDP-4-amino-4-deoxy-L-arabinose-oxoglutarate aminotransferase